MSGHEIERRLENVLHTEIPQTVHMGVSVVAWDGQALVLGAPLSLNLNHKDTAFGGSLNSLATLAGWGLIYLLLEKHGLTGQTVIQQSRIDYLLPVRDDFYAVCLAQEPAVLDRFFSTLRRRAKARLDLRADVFVDVGFDGALRRSKPCVKFEGRFVTILNRAAARVKKLAASSNPET